MSNKPRRKVKVILTRRHPADDEATLKGVARAFSRTDLEIHLQDSNASDPSTPPTRKDEALETKVREAAGKRLDEIHARRQQAANAQQTGTKPTNPKAPDLATIQKRAEDVTNARRGVRVWLAMVAAKCAEAAPVEFVKESVKASLAYMRQLVDL